MPRDTAEQPLILSPASPLRSAREMVRRRHSEPEGRTLHHQQGVFFRYQGACYIEVATESVRAEIYQFLDRAKRQTEGGELVPFNPARSKVGNVMEALAAAAQLADGIRAPVWLDGKHPPAAEMLACRNGLLHLPTRTLTAHTPAFFTLNAVDYDYDEAAPNPREWLKFLATIWPDDQSSIDTLQDMFGLLLTGDTSHQKMFLIVGPKRSGKGTIARVLTALLGGKDNVAGPTLNSLSQNFGLAPLIGKPLGIISDARLSARTDVHVIAERLLSISGEDSLTIDRKFLPAWTGRLATRFVILTNELPRLADASGALASRFIVLTLEQSFYGREDHSLTDRLLRELPGVFIWALAGRDRLAARGYFKQPPSAGQALRELEDLASPIGAFLRDRCIVGPGRAVRVEDLYGAWVAWCRDQGRDQPGTTQTFGRDLRAAVPSLGVSRPRAAGDRIRYFEGVSLDL